MKPTILTALAFLCVMLGALMCLSTASERQSSSLAWLGLGMLAITVAATVYFGWAPT